MDSREPLSNEGKEALLNSCSAVLPSPVLQSLLGLSANALSRLRKRLGIAISGRESKAVAKRFLQELPDLNLLPLSNNQRLEVRLFRLQWLERKRPGEKEERKDKLISRLSPVLPTRAIAAILGAASSTVLKRQQTLGCAPARSIRRTLEHRFAARPSCPPVTLLTGEERRRLKTAWREAHRSQRRAKRKRADQSAAYAAAMLHEMKSGRDGLQGSGLPLIACSGECGESWPPAKQFFGPNWRTPSGLSRRCKYCIYIRNAAHKHDGGRRNKRRSRRYTGAARKRLIGIVALYGELIPTALFCALFRLTREALSHFRRQAGRHMSTPRSRRILWEWFFEDQPRDFPELTVDELARLHLLSLQLKERLRAAFERDRELLLILRADAIALRSQHYGGEPLAEAVCRDCGESYPATGNFFKQRGESIEHICKVCISYAARQQRFARLRKRFARP